MKQDKTLLIKQRNQERKVSPTNIYEELKECNSTLPEALTKGGLCTPCMGFGESLACISGCGPVIEDKKPYSKLGKKYITEEGIEWAKSSMLNVLAILEAQVGDLDKAKKAARIPAFATSDDEFTERPMVASRASALFGELFGMENLSSRSAIGAGILPGNIPVKTEAIFELEKQVTEAYNSADYRGFIVNELFQKSLRESLHVYCPLRPEQDRSIEGKNLKKEITNSIPLWDGESMDCWSSEGEGEVEAREKGVLHLYIWSRAGHQPDMEVRAHDAAGGVYTTFGSYILKLDISGLGLSVGNRTYLEIKPECEGSRSPIVRMGLANNGVIKIPDAYSREGHNAMNLKNHEWNECVWEIGAIAHDKIEETSFDIYRYGKDVSIGDNMYLELKDIYFQEVGPNVIHSWQCGKERAVYPTTGYFTDGDKMAVVNMDAETFRVVHATDGSVAYRGDIKRVQGQTGELGVIDSTEPRTDGEYQIWSGSTEIETFHINQDILVPGLWRLVNSLYCEWYGYPALDCHSTYHQDAYADHNGVRMIFNGGWHDAADVFQQTIQSVEVPDAMMASTKEAQKLDEMLYLGMTEKANWGLDFALRMRFGDGYRTFHVVLRRWIDGLIGNMGDIIADVNSRPFRNFVFAAVEVGAVEAFGERDSELAWRCLDVIRKDFMSADERFRKVGLEESRVAEYTAGASLFQYHPAVVWATARLYKMTREDRLATFVEEYTDKIVACQKTGGETPMNGYFYRDETKKHIVHFPHQIRGYMFVTALAEVCETLKGHEKIEAWEQAMKLRGEYLEELKVYIQPYGMSPADTHHTPEIDDKATFDVFHPTTEYEAEEANYKEQLENSIDPGSGYCIRRFPV